MSGKSPNSMRSEGKPIVIGNCQAGWQIMMTAALNPDLMGPIMLAGSPLSYWAGVHGKNPMRYTGGLLGGTWLTALAGDLGAGVFDGANLVANFESLNLANTYWSKPYKLYSKVDTEAKRFLDFETWWGSPVLLNANEMQWIADNLFVGNKLAAGQIRTSDGVRIDLRNIRSPIICFCSWGDNITPPQQALGWILDLYQDGGEIVANGQTIVYAVHESIGHLGIFVSGQVAQKEHSEFVSVMDLIDVLPPGLYEAVIDDAGSVEGNRALIKGDYLFRLQARTLDDIRKFGVNSDLDNKRFATTARISEINLGLYQTFLQPVVRAAAGETTAVFLRDTHPHRLRFATFSDRNPSMASVKAAAETVRAHRKPVAEDNPFVAMERIGSAWITTWLEFRRRHAGRHDRGLVPQRLCVALASGDRWPRRRTRRRKPSRGARPQSRSGGHEIARNARTSLRSGWARRGLLARADLHSPAGGLDRRARLQHAQDYPRIAQGGSAARQPRFKDLLREQLQLVALDSERAIAALPKLAPAGSPEAAKALEALHLMMGARGALPEEGRRRLAQVEKMLGEQMPRSKAGRNKALGSR